MNPNRPNTRRFDMDLFARHQPGPIGSPSRAVERDDNLAALFFEVLAQMVGIIGLVGQQAAWCGDAFKQRRRNTDVGDVARCQDEGDRFALSIGQSVDLAGPPAT